MNQVLVYEEEAEYEESEDERETGAEHENRDSSSSAEEPQEDQSGPLGFRATCKCPNMQVYLC